MKYEVVITETLRRTVSVEADNQDAAEAIVQDKWNNSEYILDADDFSDVSFNSCKKTDIIREVDYLGRIYISRIIREQLKIKEGDSMEFLVDGENIVMRKCQPYEIEPLKED